jgi:hypothetical protein
MRGLNTRADTEIICHATTPEKARRRVETRIRHARLVQPAWIFVALA